MTLHITERVIISSATLLSLANYCIETFRFDITLWSEVALLDTILFLDGSTAGAKAETSIHLMHIQQERKFFFPAHSPYFIMGSMLTTPIRDITIGNSRLCGRF